MALHTMLVTIKMPWALLGNPIIQYGPDGWAHIMFMAWTPTQAVNILVASVPLLNDGLGVYLSCLLQHVGRGWFGASCLGCEQGRSLRLCVK